jgi:hypothetical protein
MCGSPSSHPRTETILLKQRKVMNLYFSPYDRETCEKTQEDITLLKISYFRCIIVRTSSVLYQQYPLPILYTLFYETDIVHPLGLPPDDLES